MQRDHNKYLVIKTEDLINALAHAKECGQDYAYHRMVDAYHVLTTEVAAFRYGMGKKPQKYVVVGEDWPEYEVVWKLIEARINAENENKV